MDTNPVFTTDGRHLAFLSTRTFDPVYDDWVFDLSFTGRHPALPGAAGGDHAVAVPPGAGRPAHRRAGCRSGDGEDDGEDDAPPQPVTVDLEGIEPAGDPGAGGDRADVRRCGRPRTGCSGWRRRRAGLLGEGRPTADGDPVRPRLVRYDFRKRRMLTPRRRGRRLHGSPATAGGCWSATSKSLRVVPADRRVDPDADGDRDAVVDVDLRRLRVQVDPAAQWRQMYDEAGRLMRDHFWIADMGGVDWDGVLERYRPLVERVATRDDLSELLWEVQGELGSSHAYEIAPAAAGPSRAGRSATSAPTCSGPATAGWCAGCCPASPRCAAPARR